MKDSDERKFQKKLALYQIGATVAASVGAVIMSMGIGLLFFGGAMELDSFDSSEERQNLLLQKSMELKQLADNTVYAGAFMIVIGTGFFMLLISIQK